MDTQQQRAVRHQRVNELKRTFQLVAGHAARGCPRLLLLQVGARRRQPP
jgi:hypothetical protein